MLRLSDLVRLHVKIKSLHLVIPNPKGPRFHLSFSIWMSLSNANVERRKLCLSFYPPPEVSEKLFPEHESILRSKLVFLPGDSFCSWLAGLTFCGWWLAVSSGPVPWRLPLYCLEVLCYWFPACAHGLTCQSLVRTVGCHREQVDDVWCLAV